MPCQRVLAPVTGAGPPQAAETAAARVPPGWSRLLASRGPWRAEEHWSWIGRLTLAAAFTAVVA